VQEGQSYRLRKRAFHQTIFHGTTVTLVVKSNQENTAPRILSPLGSAPVHAFADRADRQQVAAVIAEAAALLRGSSQNSSSPNV
jgi:hypothetical protein